MTKMHMHFLNSDDSTFFSFLIQADYYSEENNFEQGL